MDQSGNNHLLLRASQPAPPVYNGQHAAADRMRELLARTVHDHIVEERSVAGVLQEIRLRLDAMDESSMTRMAATVDALAATLGAQDSKLTARLERLDERLDDQYDRVRSIDGKLDGQVAGLEEAVAKAGGLLDVSADPQGVFVLRTEPVSVARQLNPEYPIAPGQQFVNVVYRVNLKDAGTYFLARRFPVRNKDVIYVAASPSTEWQKALALFNSVAAPAYTAAAGAVLLR